MPPSRFTALEAVGAVVVFYQQALPVVATITGVVAGQGAPVAITTAKTTTVAFTGASPATTGTFTVLRGHYQI